MKVRPLRLLNERRGSLGLNEVDFTAVGLLFVSVAFLLMNTPYMLLSFTAFIPLAVLRPIRMKYRRKIVRDYLAHKLLPRRVYAPKTKTL